MRGTTSAAYDINNSGQVVGITEFYRSEVNESGQKTYIADTRAFLLEQNELTILPILSNGTYSSGSRFSAAFGINDLGEIVGTELTNIVIEGNTSDAFVPVLYQEGKVINLGVLSDHIISFARDINDSGQIVGYSRGIVNSSQSYGAIDRGFIYQNNQMFDLNSLIAEDSGWIIEYAEAINNKGQIVGYGNKGSFLLNPIVKTFENKITVGKISTFGDTVLLQGNEITLSGKAITTQGGEITFDGATKVDGNLTIDSSVTEDEVITGGGDITFTNTLDSSSAGVGNLRVQAGTGNILFSETVGGEATFRNINVLGADIVTTTADITSDQLVRINATGDIVTQNITSDNGRVVVSSQQKSISTLDITSGSDEGDHIILQAGDRIKTKNLLANELGTVRIAAGTYLEQDNNIVGDITTESITGKRIRVESAGNFTASGDALAHDGNVVVDVQQNITIENITANNGNVRLTSNEKSLTAKDIFTIIPEAVDDEETNRNGNIILESKEGVTTANLNASELGRVNITSGEIVENDTETLEDDTIIVGDISTESITGKAVRAVGTGSFTATGDITAHDGRITVAVTNDVNTKNINSLVKSINLISTEGAVTVDGDLNSEKGGVAIHAADDINTQKIRSVDGAVALSSYDGEITIEDDINTIRGGVTIAAKEGVEVARITTGVGEVNIGSGKAIVANGNISTNVGYVNLKAGGSLNIGSVTTNDGYISLGADSNVEVSSLATGSGVINLISATGSVAAVSIDTEGSYVAIEAALDIIASAIEANGGGVNLVANSDFGGIGLIATDPDTATDVDNVIEDLNDLSPEQAGAFSEIISDVVYYSRPVGEFLLGALYGTVANNLGEAFEIGQFFLPLKLSERDRRYWTQVINSQSTAFKLGIEVANAGSIVQGIIEMLSGGATFIGGAALCTVGAGATFGISCGAGAPAMVAGSAMLVHGRSLILNGIKNDTDANLIDDLLAPQKMASTGGADGSRGLARKIGASQERVDNALEVLGTKKIEQLEGRLNFTETRFRRDASGQLVPTEQDVKLLNRVLDKSKELIYNVSKAFDLVDNDAKGIKDIDGINDIRATIRQNRDRGDRPQLINDRELNTALIENNNFIQQYQGKASGAFANRFGKANSSQQNSIQARGELNTAKDILDGNTTLGNNVKLRGLPEKTNTQTNPEYLAIMPDGNTRLVEVKTLKDNFNPRKIRTNLIDATDQIAGNKSTSPTKKGYVRLDFRNTTSISQQPNWWLDRISSALVDTRRKRGTTTTPGIEVVEFVEVLYKDPQNQIQKLLMRVNNGVVGLM